MNRSFIWLNGQLVELAEARISPLDHGFTVGDGVFETLVARGGKPFAAVRHWRRLVSSCAAVGLTAPSFESCIAAMQSVMEANQLRDARLRITVTSGEGPLGSDRGQRPSTMTVAATALHAWPAVETAITVPWTRNERGALAGVKSTSYGENARALAHAKSLGAGEAIFANTRGELCEGTGTNIFLIEQGIVKTPPLASGCLAGVTRALVLEACAAAGIACEESTLPLAALQTCEEAFLTSSTRDVHPLARIDDRVLPGESGGLTLRVARAFRDYIAGRDDP